MNPPTEVQRSGLDYLASVTELLDRVRTTHPTAGLFEAAEVQWWWVQDERPTDDFGQLFWVGEDGRPGFGLFWYNPTTGVGVVEPMRTEDDHQQRVLARHLLTSGIDRLAGVGATRIKVAFEPGNPAAKRLYLGCGFEPDRENDVFTGPTGT